MGHLNFLTKTKGLPEDERLWQSYSMKLLILLLKMYQIILLLYIHSYGWQQSEWPRSRTKIPLCVRNDTHSSSGSLSQSLFWWRRPERDEVRKQFLIARSPLKLGVRSSSLGALWAHFAQPARQQSCVRLLQGHTRVTLQGLVKGS